MTYHVPASHAVTHEAHPVATVDGWCDVTVTISGDATWSRQYSGHPRRPGPASRGEPLIVAHRRTGQEARSDLYRKFCKLIPGRTLPQARPVTMTRGADPDTTTGDEAARKCPLQY